MADAERYIRDQGFKGIRVRVHGDLARIEVSSADITALASEPVRERIVSELKRLGFRYVSLDLIGYRTGSMNEVLR